MNLFNNRRYAFIVLTILVGLIFIARLFYLQVVDNSYKVSAENNSQSHVVVYPARGLIYDRNGELLVSNQAAYDLMVVPNNVHSFDTIEFCSVLGITKQSLDDRLKKAKDYSWRVRSVFMKQVSFEVSAILQEKMYKYPGFSLQSRTLRTYSRPIASHILGYIGEVGKRLLENTDYYEMGDYIGVIGLEKSYEDILRGGKGLKIFLKDRYNRIIGSLEEGKYDKPVKVGQNMIISLDAELQEYGEKLMGKFVGSIVAIEPSSGEILTMVSSPTVDPNNLIGRKLGESIRTLSADTLNPLFNRALMAQYPPGSTFKTINALIGLQEGVINNQTSYYCDYGYYYGGIHVGCHSHETPLELIGGVQHSCNSYFCNVFRRIMENPKYENTEEAFNHWRDHLLSFGFGEKLGIDFTNELDGNIPTAAYYDKYYQKGHWNFLTIISMAIGQGELLITPLQMANMTATIANRGWFYTPHLAKSIEGKGSINTKYLEKHYASIDSAYYWPIIEGMDLAVNGGAGSTARIAKIPGIEVCGKTGTAENPHGEDHSIFIAFAPKENPQIALAVYVENEGFGGTWAAPIASLLIEKYLSNEVKRQWIEQYVLRGNTKVKEEVTE
ncbi:MAG: penicillin-binding transpeptidase domain-containing protein [Bacteroidales bacterium]|jgi:penicillin-binding protein 2|nr:penicillin-binding transpeptidase domain-containing protein [Bacteroidales bacterium]